MQDSRHPCGIAQTRFGRACYFPLEPFASSGGDVEIVVVPMDRPDAEAVLKLTSADLARMH